MESFIMLLIILAIAIIKDTIRDLISVIQGVASATSDTYTANSEDSLYINEYDEIETDDDWPYEFELYDMANYDIEDL